MGHSRWVTTRQKLANDPEALAAYEAERDRRLAEYAEEQLRDIPPDPPQAKWRIWSNTRRKWYRPQALGYTADIEESGRFMPGEALAIYHNAARGWDPVSNPFTIDVTLVPVR